MIHTRVRVEEKEVLMFYESKHQDHLPIAVETILKHLSNEKIRKVFDDLGLVNITNEEVTLFSLNGEIETLCIT
ncbi:MULTISPECIES: hypothetical protein [Paenibacillus]|uniref:Uncharacterized protein n=1 Tax=Paenibacillus violae TaxID=3077234 RepID=A0ABU3RPI1_9BACL|nr:MULTISPECIES: hypothetical protein [Paenibacillus]MDU0206207.1 hypothetical protein [Paenibacillus sp. PFR10]MEC0267008.1 hypothetical protein [Paenibacillus anseongense]